MKVEKVLNRFSFEPVNKKHADLTKEIDGPSIHRLGLELAGLTPITKRSKKVIGWGTKENNWFASMSDAKAKEIISKVITKDVPLIVLSKGFSAKTKKIVIDVANKNKTAVITSKSHLSSLVSNIGSYLAKHFAQSKDVHGSLVVVNGIGVMIIGKSGVGKSEAVLELIQKGHSFVCDDTVVIKRIGVELVGEPSKITENFLEARGIGFVDIPHIYGIKSVKPSVQIDLVVELLDASHLNKVDRLGNMNLTYDILERSIPKMQIPVGNGRTLSALIEASVNVFAAKKHGIDPFETITKRVQKGVK